MRMFLFLLADSFFAAILLIPCFCLLDRFIFRYPKRSFVYFLLAVYFCAIYSVVGLPDLRYVRFDLNINLKPFLYFFTNPVNNLLNVIMFVPLGFFLPILFRRYLKLWRTILFGFLFSLLIELLQIFTFRATDVNDLMTNTLGTLLGYIIARFVLLGFPSILSSRRTQDLFIILGVSFGIMFFLHPFLSLIPIQALFKTII